jgi:hypothetical protein
MKSPPLGGLTVRGACRQAAAMLFVHALSTATETKIDHPRPAGVAVTARSSTRETGRDGYGTSSQGARAPVGVFWRAVVRW